MRNKGIQLGAMFAAMLILLSAMIVPVATAKDEGIPIGSTLNEPQVKQIVINPVNLQPGQVITPFGTIMNKSQVYEVKSGEFIDMFNISRNITGEPIQPPAFNGWIEDAWYNYDTGISGRPFFRKLGRTFVAYQYRFSDLFIHCTGTQGRVQHPATCIAVG